MKKTEHKEPNGKKLGGGRRLQLIPLILGGYGAFLGIRPARNLGRRAGYGLTGETGRCGAGKAVHSDGHRRKRKFPDYTGGFAATDGSAHKGERPRAV